MQGYPIFSFLFCFFVIEYDRCGKLPQITLFRKVKTMKRMFTLLLCALLLLSFTACGSSDETEPTAATVSATTPATEAAAVTEGTEPTQAPTEPRVIPEDLVLVDNGNVTFTILKVENNAHMGMQLQVECVNNTDRTLMFSWDMVSVCGYMYDPFWAEEVAAGKTAVSTVDLDTYALGKMGIDSVDEITFTLRIYDSENWMDEPLVAEVFTVYPTGLRAETFTVPPQVFAEDHVVIAEDENIRFVIEGVSDEGESGYKVHVYLENKTDRNLLYSWDLVSVNGRMVDPYWGASVGAGKRACTDIVFLRSDFEQNGITDVTDIEFTLAVSDYDDFEAGSLLEETYTYHP